MSYIRALLLPAVQRDPSQPLTIRIILPRNASSLTVRLVELDSWRFLREDMLEEEGGVGSTLATFNGSMSAGTFEIAGTEIPEAQADEGSLTIKFHGSSDEYAVPVSREVTDSEGGELELGLEIDATITRRGREVQEQFRSPTPTFIRNVAQTGSGGRPILAIITGHDEYQRAARRYWQRRADVVVIRRSVESILQYLGNAENVRAIGCEKWGQINIVSHASIETWNIPLFDQNRRDWTPVDYPMLRNHGDDPRLAAPPESIVDGNSQLVLRGCNIGQNRDLCEAIRRLFGNRAALHAPRFLQTYQWETRGGRRIEREYFKQSLYFFVPGQRSPSNDECLRRFKEKYRDLNIDDAEWQRLMEAEGERERRDGNDGWQFAKPYDRFPPLLDEHVLEDLRRDWPGGALTYHTEVADWQWSHSPQFNRRDDGSLAWRLLLTAWRRMVQVRRPLRSDSGEIIVPDLNDATHYQILS